MGTTGARGRPTLPATRRTAASAVVVLLVVEVIAAIAYVRVTDTGVLAPRYTLYPFVWINVAAWVALRRPTLAAPTRRRLAAGGIAVAYFLALSYAGGLVGVATGGTEATTSVAWLSPGWGPLVVYSGRLLSVTVIPFEVAGYAALAALVYTVVLAGARSAVAGLLGLATCVGCLWPLGAALVAALGGVASPLATVGPGVAYDVSTVLFVLTAGVLHWSARRVA